jgi:hypothetical protein
MFGGRRSIRQFRDRSEQFRLCRLLHRFTKGASRPYGDLLRDDAGKLFGTVIGGVY